MVQWNVIGANICPSTAAGQIRFEINYP